MHSYGLEWNDTRTKQNQADEGRNLKKDGTLTWKVLEEVISGSDDAAGWGWKEPLWAGFPPSSAWFAPSLVEEDKSCTVEVASGALEDMNEAEDAFESTMGDICWSTACLLSWTEGSDDSLVAFNSLSTLASRLGEEFNSSSAFGWVCWAFCCDLCTTATALLLQSGALEDGEANEPRPNSDLKAYITTTVSRLRFNWSKPMYNCPWSKYNFVHFISRQLR